MIFKVFLQYQGLNVYKIYINDDPGLSLGYYEPRSNSMHYTFMLRKLLESHLMENNASIHISTKGLCFIFGLSASVPGSCIHVNIIFKHTYPLKQFVRCINDEK